MPPFDQRARPVEQVADVGEDLARRARLRRGAELGEPLRRVADRLAAAVGDGGQAMAKEDALHLLVVAVAAVVHVGLLWGRHSVPAAPAPPSRRPWVRSGGLPCNTDECSMR